ncbi:unnamed protein product [Closterium sp. NIES-65]|nr:unnamed protein product [Closterium sp. NIES-65]
MGDSQYSFSLTTFSPSGKLVQIEYALNAVAAGATSLGIKATNGVVIATEKKLPTELIDETSVKKIQLLTDNSGVVYRRAFRRHSWCSPPRAVPHMPIAVPHMPIPVPHVPIPVPHMPIAVPHMPIPVPHVPIPVPHMPIAVPHMPIAVPHMPIAVPHMPIAEGIPVSQLVRETAAVMQEFTQSGGVRPFGVSLLMAGYDSQGPHLYQVDPSGSYFAWKASAIGKNMTNAKTFLEKRYTEDMELEDAIHTAILTLKEGFEGQIAGDNIEIGIVGSDKKFSLLRCFPSLSSLHMHSRKIHFTCSLMHRLPPPSISLHRTPPLSVRALLAINRASCLHSLHATYVRVDWWFPSPVRSLANSPQVQGKLHAVTLPPALAFLDLSYTAVSGALPNTLSTLTNLAYLELAYTSLSGQLPSTLSALSKLSHLWVPNIHLQGGQVGGSITTLTFVSHLTRLHTLELFGFDAMTDGHMTSLSGLSTLTRLQKLTYFRNVSCNFANPFPNTLLFTNRALFSHFPTGHRSQPLYTARDLSYNYFSDFPTWIVDLTRLQYIDVLHQYEQRWGYIPRDLDRLTGLRTLSVSAAPCQSVPHLVSQCRTLSVSAAPCHLAVGNGLSGFLPETWSRLTALERLHLKSSSALSPCPPTTSHLTQFSLSDLQGNKLEGSIPGSYSVLKALTYLNLGNNQFSGPIPDFLGSLPNLMELMASRNLLSGALPSALQTSASLEQLVDHAPQGGPCATGWTMRHRVDHAPQGGPCATGWTMRHRVDHAPQGGPCATGWTMHHRVDHAPQGGPCATGWTMHHRVDHAPQGGPCATGWTMHHRVDHAPQGGPCATGWTMRHRVDHAPQGGPCATGWTMRHRVDHAPQGGPCATLEPRLSLTAASSPGANANPSSAAMPARPCRHLEGNGIAGSLPDFSRWNTSLTALYGRCMATGVGVGRCSFLWQRACRVSTGLPSLEHVSLCSVRSLLCVCNG